MVTDNSLFNDYMYGSTEINSQQINSLKHNRVSLTIPLTTAELGITLTYLILQITELNISYNITDDRFISRATGLITTVLYTIMYW